MPRTVACGDPSAGDAVSAIGCRSLPYMERTALIAEEQTPLDVGSLVSLSINICEPLPGARRRRRRALVRAADREPRRLQGRRSRGHRLEHRRRALRAAHARHARLRHLVAAHGLAAGDHHPHRRPPRRRALRARRRRQPAARGPRGARVHARSLDPRRRPAARGRHAAARHARRPRGARRPRRAAAARQRARHAHERDDARRAWRASASRSTTRRASRARPAACSRCSASVSCCRPRAGARARRRSRAARSGARIVKSQLEPGEHAGHPVERADAHAQQRAAVLLRELGERRRQALGGLIDREVEQHLDLPRPRHAREREAHVRDRVEAGRRRDGRGAGRRGARHAIDAERAQVVAPVVERGQVPAARVHDEAVRAQLALSSARPRTSGSRCRRAGGA